jgi:hypothetical protein
MVSRNALGTQTRHTGYTAITTQGGSCMLRSGSKDTRMAVSKEIRRAVLMASRGALGTQRRNSSYKATTTQGEACMLRSGAKDIRMAANRGIRRYGDPYEWMAATP